MNTPEPEIAIPRIGMLATVRNRRGVISGVHPYGGQDGQLHLVDVEYNDGATPLEQSILWEREPYARLLKPGVLPDPSSSDPMSHGDFDALVRACRWSARMPFIDPDGSGPMDRLPVSSPFHGAVQIEDYQLVPLLKAMKMPRVSLLIADDVGLGKTIEAGLILSELLLRRRVRRVLILTPAALRDQWQEELWDKFSLGFDIVDRDATTKLRRQVGMDANPWRSYSRVITSYHYLKQPDVLEQFRAASEAEQGTGRLPWDLLIVDEAHNLSPPPFGDESELTRMLRQVTPLCEHRIFLTATPHNGHTRSFTGLLELLDPVRFSQTAELKPAERARVQDVLVRRLKREINERSNPKKFADRLPPIARVIGLSPNEKLLSAAFDDFRAKVISLVRSGGKGRRLAGTFAIEILGKRLLSCPVAFADSWHRCRRGMQEVESASESEVMAAKRSVTDENADDREAESLSRTAASTVGAWLKPMADDIETEASQIDQALDKLALPSGIEKITDTDPQSDSRYESLLALTAELLKDGEDWKPDERLIIFTEYKTTLDYLTRRLRKDLGDSARILTLFGGMDTNERRAVKQAFNDPDHQVRILVGTDAASEGLNLQKSARYLFHYDVPWNPARLEQRNGRLDRHGQARDVSVWHFASDDDQDLKFLDLIVRKVDSIREDLGATGEVFDELTYGKLIAGQKLEDIQRDLDVKVAAAKQAVDIPRDDQSAPVSGTGETDPSMDLAVIAAELDLDARSLRETLDSAMSIQKGRPRLEGPDDSGHCRILPDFHPSWSEVIDDTIRMPTTRGRLGALPALVFEPKALTEAVNGRSIFRPRPDVLLMHLAQPLIQRALTALTRLRFPGGARVEVSRWTFSEGGVEEGTDAVIKLTFEELGVNELRETFHHWVRTVRLPVVNGEHGAPLEHKPPMVERRNGVGSKSLETEKAQDIWLDAGADLRGWLQNYGEELTRELAKQLALDKQRALDEESERYRSRQGEVSSLIESSTMTKLERELEDLRARRQQGLLFSEQEEFDALDRNIGLREEELKRRGRHMEEVREQLAIERAYILDNVIPNRYTMRGDAQVLPITVEILLPGANS